MHLTALYTVFNGYEQLEGSIRLIYPLVDNIVISFQEVSNKGETDNGVRGKMNLFKHMPKVRIIEYSPNLKLSTKENERRKHQQLINYAKGLQSTHYFLSACDHYYEPKQFLKAKVYLQENPFDVSFTKMYTYYKLPVWRLEPIEDYYMPFICKLYPNTEVVQNINYPVLVDPSVRVTTSKTFRTFTESEIMMHHFSMVRADIQSKFRNSASSVNWTKERLQTFIDEYENAYEGMEVTYFKGRKLKRVTLPFEF